MNKPFSQACENNREPIARVLEQEFIQPGMVLEVGSGTGQHCAWFHHRLPHLKWQCSDIASNLPGIQLWLDDLDPTPPAPVEFDVNGPLPELPKADYLFSANTAHIMSWEEVERLFAQVAILLKPSGKFALYGPFNYNGQFTSSSNARFNDWLGQQAPHRAIRDFEAVNRLALENGLEQVNDYEMPANNRLLVWQLTN